MPPGSRAGLVTDQGREAARCSVLVRAAGEPLLGTAPQAQVWVGVEQAGPWGPRPLQRAQDSHLPAVLRELLGDLDRPPQVKVLLLRRPGRHADAPPRETREVLVAGTSPTHPFLVQVTCGAPDDLLALDLPRATSAALAGTAPGWGRPVDHPVTLVCTNSRRDRCCALAGRPVAAELARRCPGTVWECTHLGGHRFAPTSLVLPAGAVYGGLDATTLATTVEALAGRRLPLDGLRGLSRWSPREQVADAAVRSALGVDALDATTVTGSEQLADDATRVTVTSPNGRWTVVVRQVTGPDRAESCGKPPVPRHDLVADHPVPA